MSAQEKPGMEHLFM